MPTNEGQVSFIPGGAYGYPATQDPEADQTTHQLIPGEGGLPFIIPKYLSTVSTFDNAPAINAALQQANAAGGGMVFIPNGKYTIGSATSTGTILLDIPSNTTLKLQSTATILKAAANLPANIAILIGNSDTLAWGFGVEGSGILDGNRQNQTHQQLGIFFTSSNHAGPYVFPYGSGTMGSGVMDFVRDLLLVNTSSSAIYFDSTITGLIHDVECFNCYAGITIFSDCELANFTIGLIDSGSGLTIAGNSQVVDGKVYGAGVLGSFAAVSVGQGAILDDVFVQECPGIGFQVSGSNVGMSNASVQGVDSAGIYLTGTANACRLQCVVSQALGLPSGNYTPTYGLYADTTGVNTLDIATDGHMSIANLGGPTIASQFKYSLVAAP